MIKDVPDQNPLWDQWHRAKGASGSDPVHLTLRATLLATLPDQPRPRWLPPLLRRPQCTVLDLGCGQGHDVAAFARAGFRVCGLDFSTEAVRQTRRRIPWSHRRHVEVCTHNLAHPLPYPDGVFSATYSHLALHYFDDPTTRAIFAEVRRVLRPEGAFIFSVKSTDDPLCGEGDTIGENIYCRDGHLRHFFDADHLRSLLDGWTVREVTAHKGHYASASPSAFLHVTAHRAP